MDKAIFLIIGVLIISALMWILLPTFKTFILAADLQAIQVSKNAVRDENYTITGYTYTTYNGGWAGGLFTILYVLAAALLPLGVIGYVIYSYKHKS